MDFFKGQFFRINNPNHPANGQIGQAVTEPSADESSVMLRLPSGAHVEQRPLGLTLIQGAVPDLTPYDDSGEGEQCS